MAESELRQIALDLARVLTRLDLLQNASNAGPFLDIALDVINSELVANDEAIVKHTPLADWSAGHTSKK